MDETSSGDLRPIDRAATAKAIRDAEEERTRQAYLEKPDVPIDDDWADAEDWAS
jgi:hypothetical protein